jgi:UDP-glucose 4-epimerase
MFNLPIIMLPERKGNRMSASVETQKTKSELGWQAEKKIEDYIKEITGN